jgi:hypothetical protein
MLPLYIYASVHRHKVVVWVSDTTKTLSATVRSRSSKDLCWMPEILLTKTLSTMMCHTCVVNDSHGTPEMLFQSATNLCSQFFVPSNDMPHVFTVL